MGFCCSKNEARRCLFLSICLLQIMSVTTRQIFDFLGYLWVPIIINLFEVIFLIFGFFGAYQQRHQYVGACLLWHIFWLGWNVFLICLYLDIAGLDHKTNKVLKLDYDSGSWWMKEGPGCKTKQNEKTTSCAVDYVHYEICQAGLQCLLASFSFVTGIGLKQSSDRCDSYPQKFPCDKRTSLYSIELSSQLERHHNSDNELDHIPATVSPKPMTPRRVKRRSVMTRGSSGRHSTNSRRKMHLTAKNSRGISQNPIIQQKKQKTPICLDPPAYGGPSCSSPIESSCNNFNNSSSNINLLSPHIWQANNGHTNPTYQKSSTQSLNYSEEFDDVYNNRPASVRSTYSNFHGTRALNYTTSVHFHSHATPQVPQKRHNPNRISMRAMAFLNNGPPAYDHGPNSTPVNSETAI